MSHLRAQQLLVAELLAVPLVAAHARVDALQHADLALRACERDKLRRARDAHRLELREDRVQRVRARRARGGVVLVEQPDEQVDVLEGLVRALAEVLCGPVSAVGKARDDAWKNVPGSSGVLRRR